jgi:protein TonB
MVYTSDTYHPDMSYKSLLFCPEEKTARLVTQVLSELEFTVTLSNDPQATVARLANEHFDALVVDIANEQDAALLFKSARDSELNHSALAVAVVEGQAGVAKAFRIGGNLVLTKPINIEQSKGTLRVARGLLRKNEAKAAPISPPKPTATLEIPSLPKPMVSMPAIPASLLAQPAAKTADAPFSSLEVEEEATPAPEPAEVALIESMPDPSGSKPAASGPTWAPKLKSSAEPIAASTGSAAGAAVAPAMEKPVVELKSAPPMATQEAITADPGVREEFQAATVPVPNFSYSHDSGSSKKIIKTIIMLVLMAVAGYAAWQRLQLGQYLPNLKGLISKSDSEPASPVGESPVASAPAPVPAKQTPAPSSELVFPDTTPAATDDSSNAPASPRTADRSPAAETIQVDELSSTSEPKITVTPKAQPIVVKPSKVSSAKPSQPAAPAPPTIAVSSGSSQALANIVATDAPQPKLQVLRVSQGVSQGLLMKKIAPSYPQAALQMRMYGEVELLATVSKQGLIERINVLNGDPVLVKAATDAVKQWKYRPYLLNGEPVEIETQITVSFKLPN